MKILLIEDENAAARRLEKLVMKVDSNAEVVAILDGIRNSVNWLKKNDHPDLILMDIHLSDGPCFKIFEEVEINIPVIFTTAYDEYALKAFEVNSVDYLLKPIKMEDLEQALKKYRRFYGKTDEFKPNQQLADFIKEISSPAKKRFTIRIGSKIRLVYEKEIAYCYTSDKITFICTFDNKRFPLDLSMDGLENALDRNSFFRINRQYIINISAIEEMYAYSKSRVKVSLNPAPEDDLIVSVERSGRFKKWLEGG